MQTSDERVVDTTRGPNVARTATRVQPLALSIYCGMIPEVTTSCKPSLQYGSLPTKLEDRIL